MNLCMSPPNQGPGKYSKFRWICLNSQGPCMCVVRLVYGIGSRQPHQVLRIAYRRHVRMRVSQVTNTLTEAGLAQQSRRLWHCQVGLLKTQPTKEKSILSIDSHITRSCETHTTHLCFIHTRRTAQQFLIRDCAISRPIIARNDLSKGRESQGKDGKGTG